MSQNCLDAVGPLDCLGVAQHIPSYGREVIFVGWIVTSPAVVVLPWLISCSVCIHFRLFACASLRRLMDTFCYWATIRWNVSNYCLFLLTAFFKRAQRAPPYPFRNRREVRGTLNRTSGGGALPSRVLLRYFLMKRASSA
ncbi:hypothetical protein QBC35DRAFT_175026 [Podospora australis]|uniref:Uncharacterized protein n=1 Tax=Podospora australis TaxID=1536484 RepID=A0AAN6WVH2_9PEZI|nr:hypothetical protein QBC35DRAFT_175026 [Podospora australis]